MPSPAIGVRTGWAPNQAARVEWSHPIAQGLVLCTVDAGGTQVDIVNRRVAPGRGMRATERGSATLFDGNQTSTSSFFARMDGATQMTFRWYGTWSTFANNDNLAVEYSTNANTTVGFFFDPNGSGPAGFAALKFGTGQPNQGSNTTKSYARWTANQATHIAASNNFASTAGHTAYLNGAAWAVNSVESTPATTTDTVPNETVYLMSRGGSNLRASGSVISLAIWRRVLSAAEHAQLGADPFCFLRS